MKSVTTGDPKARADIEDNFRKTIGQALGGLAVLLGAVIRVEPAWKMNTALGSPCASRVSVPVRPSAEAAL